MRSLSCDSPCSDYICVSCTQPQNPCFSDSYLSACPPINFRSLILPISLPILIQLIPAPFNPSPFHELLQTQHKKPGTRSIRVHARHICSHVVFDPHISVPSISHRLGVPELATDQAEIEGRHWSKGDAFLRLGYQVAQNMVPQFLRERFHGGHGGRKSGRC